MKGIILAGRNAQLTALGQQQEKTTYGQYLLDLAKM